MLLMLMVMLMLMVVVRDRIIACAAMRGIILLMMVAEIGPSAILHLMMLLLLLRINLLLTDSWCAWRSPSLLLALRGLVVLLLSRGRPCLLSEERAAVPLLVLVLDSHFTHLVVVLRLLLLLLVMWLDHH